MSHLVGAGLADPCLLGAAGAKVSRSRAIWSLPLECVHCGLCATHTRDCRGPKESLGMRCSLSRPRVPRLDSSRCCGLTMVAPEGTGEDGIPWCRWCLPRQRFLRRLVTAEAHSLEPVRRPPGVRLVVALLALLAPRDGELCRQADVAANWGSPARLLWDLGRCS